MKKILFLLVLIYSYSFSETCYSDSASLHFTNNTGRLSLPYVSAEKVGNKWFIYYLEGFSYQCGTTPIPPPVTGDEDNPAGLCSMVNGVFTCVKNPDPLGGKRCRDLFQKDGVAYTCNPNTNEATPIPNSDGVGLDENGDNIPRCNDGYEHTMTARLSNQDDVNYTDWGCAAKSGTGDGGSGTGSGSGTGDGGSSPTITTNADGSKSWTLPNGTNYNLTTNGTLTTTYPDGSSSVSQVGSDYSAGSSGGGSGSSGGGGGSGAGNTTNENNETPTTDTPIDNTPVADSCNDTGLTLQEKMLCELNAGMKKQNSENAPENSLNQLLKDLKTSNQTDNTALNTNLKDIKALNENQLNKQTQANSTLEKINDSANATELYAKVMNESMNKIIGDDSTETPDLSDLKDSSSWINGVLDEYKTFYNNLKDSGDSFTAFANGAKDTINQGFTLNLSSSQLVNCPLDYVIDLSSMGQESININVDFCEQTSKLRPYLYPFILIILFISIIFFTLSFVRGL
jgi:hypothetical protein